MNPKNPTGIRFAEMPDPPPDPEKDTLFYELIKTKDGWIGTVRDDQGKELWITEPKSGEGVAKRIVRRWITRRHHNAIRRE